jgi:hypothetical protein
VPPFAGPVLLRAGRWSGHFPPVEDLQGRTPLERRMRSVGVVLDSVQLSGAQLADDLLWSVALAFHGASPGQVWPGGKL